MEFKSENAAQFIKEYLTNNDRGLGEPMSRIHHPSFDAAGVICDECNFYFDFNIIHRKGRTCEEELMKMLSACAGKLTYSGGKWFLEVGLWEATTKGK